MSNYIEPIRSYDEALDRFNTTKPNRNTDHIPLRQDRSNSTDYRISASYAAPGSDQPVIHCTMYSTDIVSYYPNNSIRISDYNSVTTREVQNMILQGTRLVVGQLHGYKTLNGYYMLDDTPAMPATTTTTTTTTTTSNRRYTIPDVHKGEGIYRSAHLPKQARPFIERFLHWFGNYIQLEAQPLVPDYIPQYKSVWELLDAALKPESSGVMPVSFHTFLQEFVSLGISAWSRHSLMSSVITMRSALGDVYKWRVAPSSRKPDKIVPTSQASIIALLTLPDYVK